MKLKLIRVLVEAIAQSKMPLSKLAMLALVKKTLQEMHANTKIGLHH